MEDKNLAALIRQAIEDSGFSRVYDNPLTFPQKLTSWAVAYCALGDRKAGDTLFKVALKVLDERIRYLGDNHPYTANYREFILFTQRIVESNKRPLVELPRESLVNVPTADLRVFQGMTNNYHQTIFDLFERINSCPLFIEDIAKYGKPQQPQSVIEQKRLPRGLVKEAKRLKDEYYAGTSHISLRIAWTNFARQVYQEYANRLSVNTR